MELKYHLTLDDYIAFNLAHFKQDRNTRRRRLIARIMGPVLLIAAAGLIMLYVGRFDTLVTVIYGIFAVLWVITYPSYEEKRLKKNLQKMLESSENRFILGDRTLMLGEAEFISSGEKNENRCRYELIERMCADDGHFYLYVGAANAVIIPFSAFGSEREKQEFVALLTEKVQKAGGNL